MFGKTLIIVGAFIVLIGLILVFAPKMPFLGKLPGDIYFKRNGFSFYFPLATSIIISIVLSIVIYLFSKK